GDQWTVTRPDGDVAAVQAKIKLDPSKKPREIDLISKGGRSMSGIYKLEGDTLTFCRPGPSKNAERPKEFKTADSPNEIIVWKRTVKKEPAWPPSPHARRKWRQVSGRCSVSRALCTGFAGARKLGRSQGYAAELLRFT